MQGIKKEASRANLKSRQCQRCCFNRSCSITTSSVCFAAFEEGFRKGAKWAEKQLKIKN